MSAPALVSVRASLDVVRTALVGLGAVTQDRRSVALDLGDVLLLLDYEDADRTTTVAVGGLNCLSTATWLAHQLDDLGFAVAGVLPPPVATPA